MIKGIFDALAADGTLVGLITTFKGEPAIFTPVADPQAELPYIVLTGPIINENFDTKTKNGLQPIFDIKVYTAETGSRVAVDVIAAQVHTVLHRGTIVITGYTLIHALVDGPVEQVEEGVYGRRLSCRLVLEET